MWKHKQTNYSVYKWLISLSNITPGTINILLYNFFHTINFHFFATCMECWLCQSWKKYSRAGYSESPLSESMRNEDTWWGLENRGQLTFIHWPLGFLGPKRLLNGFGITISYFDRNTEKYWKNYCHSSVYLRAFETRLQRINGRHGECFIFLHEVLLIYIKGFFLF